MEVWCAITPTEQLRKKHLLNIALQILQRSLNNRAVKKVQFANSYNLVEYSKNPASRLYVYYIVVIFRKIC